MYENSAQKIREVIPDLQEKLRTCRELVIKLHASNNRLNDALNGPSPEPTSAGLVESKPYGMIEKLEGIADELFTSLTNACATYEEHLDVLLGSKKSKP